MRSAHTRSLEHLNKAGVRATLDSKLEEHRSVIKFLLFEGATFFKGCRNYFKASISRSSGSCCPTPYSPDIAPLRLLFDPELKQQDHDST